MRQDRTRTLAGVVELPDVPLSDGIQTGDGRPDAVGVPAVEVGVLLTLRPGGPGAPGGPSAPGGLGEWLADAAAFDAGGVHALWMDAPPELDALALAAALAVVTFRARLVVALPEPGGAPAPTPAALARTLHTVWRLSNGRLALIAGEDTAGDNTAGKDAVTEGAAGEDAAGAGEPAGARAGDAGGRGTGLAPEVPGVEIFRRVPGEPGAFVAPGAGEEGAGPRQWVPVPAPQGRAAWRAALAEAGARGAHGVLVAADPRLLDILRNPDDPGDRHDLQLAQG